MFRQNFVQQYYKPRRGLIFLKFQKLNQNQVNHRELVLFYYEFVNYVNANRNELHINRIWWGLTQGSADDDTGHVDIQEKGSSTD